MRSFPIWGSRPPNRKEAHLSVSQASNIAQIIIKVDNSGFNCLLINNSEYITDTIKVVPLRTTKHGKCYATLLQAHDHDHASVLWIVHVEAVCLLVVLPRQLGAVGIICLWGTCTCWEFRRNPWATGTQQSKTLVPELVKLLGRIRWSL